MLRAPSNRRKARGGASLNLIPILDAVFIFIFFLLITANFVKIFEIGSNVPISSDRDPPDKKKPLALTLKIRSDGIALYRGVPSVAVKRFGKSDPDTYDLETLHNYLVDLKTRYKNEKTIILEPLFDIEYEKLVQIMDAIRLFKNTDPKITIKSKDGVDMIAEELFSDIVFGNIQS